MSSTNDLVLPKHRPALVWMVIFWGLVLIGGIIVMTRPEAFEWPVAIDRNIVWIVGVAGLVAGLRGVLRTVVQIVRREIAVELSPSRIVDHTQTVISGSSRGLAWSEIVRVEQEVEGAGSVLVLKTRHGDDLRILLRFLSGADSIRLLQEVEARVHEG